MRNYKYLVLIQLLLALATSCGSGNAHGPSEPEQAALDHLQLRVLSESFLEGSSAAGFSLDSRQDGDILQVAVKVRDAYRLRALYYELSYDAALCSPLDAVPDPAFSCGEEPLQIFSGQLSGVLSAGMVMPDPDACEGFSGSGTLATVRFRLEHELQGRVASEINASLDALPLDIRYRSDLKRLSWLYNSPGDYDQNGEVNPADLTPLAREFGRQQDDTFDIRRVYSVIDGDGNGEINLCDIAVIARHLGNDGLGGFRIMEQLDGSTRELGTVAFSEAMGDPANTRLYFFYRPDQPVLGAIYWPQMLDSSGTPGISPTAEQVNLSCIPILLLDDEDKPQEGSGTEEDPYILTNETVVNSYSFTLFANGEFLDSVEEIQIQAFSPGDEDAASKSGRRDYKYERPGGEFRFNQDWHNRMCIITGSVGKEKAHEKIHFYYRYVKPPGLRVVLDSMQLISSGSGCYGDPHVLRTDIEDQPISFSLWISDREVTNQSFYAFETSPIEIGCLLNEGSGILSSWTQLKIGLTRISAEEIQGCVIGGSENHIWLERRK